MVGDRPTLLDTPSRVFLSLLGSVAGAVLIACILRDWRPGSWTAPLVLFTLLQVPFLAIVSDLFDRYFLFLLPGTLYLAGPGPAASSASGNKWGRVTGLATVVLMGAISVGLMHDWLSWNVARWELGDRALLKKIPPLQIEGGFEWDGRYAAVRSANSRTNQAGGWLLPFTRYWFPTIQGRYALAFSEGQGTRTVDSQPYTLWLTPGQRRFYLLEALPLPSNQPAPPAR
jgi:hypothetical protein